MAFRFGGPVLHATVVLLVLSGCGEADLLGPEAEQGIDGTVLLGPQCPVQTQQDPCPDLPYQAWIEVRDAIGVMVTRVQSGEDGHFRVGLTPGPYVLVPENGQPFPVAGDVNVVVMEGVYTEVVVSYDTGIR